MADSGPDDAGQVEVPDPARMIVPEARRQGHEAGLVVVSADPDGPPPGGLTWPGTWIVTAQHPAPGARLGRWDNLVIEFGERRGSEGAGDHEPRITLPDPGARAAELPPPTQPGSRDPGILMRARPTDATLTRSAARCDRLSLPPQRVM